MAGLPPIELLEESHDFPGRYTFKVFGDNNQSFVDATRRAVDEATGGQGDARVSVRPSSAGTYTCVTLVVRVQSAHQVHAVYTELSALDGVRMML